MSRVLVVEPHKMLQQAFVVALFPEHEVHASERIPDVSIDADVLIVDAVALHQRGWLSDREIGEIRAWKIPVVWIGDERGPESDTISNAAMLTRPVTREALRAAVAQSLATRTAQPSGAPEMRHQRSSRDGKAEAHRLNESTKEVIDLVDVVEETPAREAVENKTGNKR